MLTDTVFQCLLNEGMPHSWIQAMIDDALNYGYAESKTFGIRLINTNSGMPAEFRIERI